MKKITINIIFAILMMMVWQVTSAFAGATFTVNDSSTGKTCNNTLSLFEAASLKYHLQFVAHRSLASRKYLRSASDTRREKSSYRRNIYYWLRRSACRLHFSHLDNT